MKENQKIPLSRYAETQLDKNFNRYFGLAIGVTIAALIVGMIWAMIVESGKPFLWTGAVSLIVWLLSMLLFKRWKKDRQDIISQNEADFRLSLRLKGALKKFSSIKVSDFPVLEKQIGNLWKPFRIEHFLSNSLRAEIRATRVTLLGGMVEGIAKGITIPNLLDSSSVLFLKNDGKTLRVLIPSSRATKEMLVKTLEILLSDLPKDSYIYRTLENFSLTDENLLNPVSHPEFIDLLDSSCELPIRQRPDVIVKGEKVQEGVVIGTALGAEGQEKIFLPSGFFQKLVTKTSSLLGKKTQALESTEALRV